MARLASACLCWCSEVSGAADMDKGHRRTSKRKHRPVERLVEGLIGAAGSLAIVFVLAILAFLLRDALPVLKTTGLGAMLTGDLQPAGALVSLVGRRARHAEWEALLGRRRFTLPAQLGTFGARRG